MRLILRYDNTQKSLKWSSNIRDGDSRDSEKILCNKCPLKYEFRERGRSEMLYKNMLKKTPTLEDLQVQVKLISLINEHVAWAQPSMIEYL